MNKKITKKSIAIAVVATTALQVTAMLANNFKRYNTSASVTTKKEICDDYGNYNVSIMKKNNNTFNLLLSDKNAPYFPTKPYLLYGKNAFR